MRVRKIWSSAFTLLLVFGCFLALSVDPAARAQAPPRYKVDPYWPKELPNNWDVANIEGVAVDQADRIWVLQAPRLLSAANADAAQKPPRAACCFPAPSVLVFDAGGNVLKSWGGPGYVPDWPTSENGIDVDKEGDVWIGGNWLAQFALAAGQPPKETPWDRQVLKFTNDGKQLLEIGHPSQAPLNNQDTTILGGPSGIAVDDGAHEVYIADGNQNKRVVVYDSNTGAFKRGWGAYGIPLSDIDNGKMPQYDPSGPAAKQFSSVRCIEISRDGLVYVGDHQYDRIQVFTKDGKFVKEFSVAPKTLGGGSVWAIAFSHDPKQKYLLVGDGENDVIWIVNRGDGSLVGQFGHKGRNAGQLDSLLTMAMDSHGNLYTGEVRTSRIQKWTLQRK